MAIELELNKMRQQRWQRIMFLSVFILIALFFVAALMHIGAGDAEWAGMSVSNVTPAMRMEFGIPKDEQGVVVNWCEGTAYAAGVRSGDLIKSINNQTVLDLSDFLKVARNVNHQPGFLLDLLRNGQPLYITMENKRAVANHIAKTAPVSHSTGKLVDTTPVITHTPVGGTLDQKGMVPAAFANASPAETGEAQAVAPSAASAAEPQVSLPSPKEQGAAFKELVEGHWLGMELIPTTVELSKEFNIPLDIKGLLVDEISLESAETGILAGDMVVAVDGFATPDLASFTEATRRVKNRHRAKVTVSRRGKVMEFNFTSVRTMGFSQNEAAQPITPGALSPHRSRGKACTACHIIMVTGGQLPTDAGDILPSPPPILKGSVPPHEDRGKCNTCHVILKQLPGAI